MFKVHTVGLKKLQKDMDIQGRKQKRALETAIKVEGFRQLRRLRDDVREGRPGGKFYAAELSKIARRTKTGRLKKKQIPLYKLAKLLRYNVEYVNRDLQMYFGFVSTRKRRLDSSWKRLLLKHEEGTDVLYSGSRTELGIEFANIGARLLKKGDPDAKYFFLKRNSGRSKGFRIPQRQIIDPYWKAHQQEAKRNISRNFARKMRGQVIGRDQLPPRMKGAG